MNGLFIKRNVVGVICGILFSCLGFASKINFAEVKSIQGNPVIYTSPIYGIYKNQNSIAYKRIIVQWGTSRYQVVKGLFKIGLDGKAQFTGIHKTYAFYRFCGLSANGKVAKCSGKENFNFLPNQSACSYAPVNVRGTFEPQDEFCHQLNPSSDIDFPERNANDHEFSDVNF